MRSLKTRLIIGAVIWITVGVAVAGVLLSTVFREFLVAQYYEQLHVHLDELERLIELDPEGQLKLQRPLSDPRYSAHLSGYYWEIQRRNQPLARSPSLEGPPLKVHDGGEGNAQTHTYRIDGPTGELLIAERLRWLGNDPAPVRIIIGADQANVDREMQKFNYVLVWSLGGFSVSLIIAAILLLLYALSPFGQLRRELAAVRKGSATYLGDQFPEEVQPLIDDLNNLLASSGEQMVRARTQAGNMGHSLKSALALLVDEAHALQERGETKSAEIIFEQAKRMQRQIDYQTARARAAASRVKLGQTASLSAAVEAVISALSRIHAGRMITIENEVPSETFVFCDSDDLNEMLANLVDNACKHAKRVVRLGIEKSGPRTYVAVVIEDDGKGLPPEAWEIVFNIGEQWGNTSQGSGLGLAIVRDLAQLHGGSVRLDQSDLGGLKVVLELPTSADVRKQSA